MIDVLNCGVLGNDQGLHIWSGLSSFLNFFDTKDFVSRASLLVLLYELKPTTLLFCFFILALDKGGGNTW